jgi:cytochrome b subunit of formate dehydrogenase
VHDVRKSGHPASPISPLRVADTCAGCHAVLGREAVTPDSIATFVRQYRESVHGQAITGGLSVSATCQSCHGSHEVHRGSDARSAMHRNQIPQTCGKCHTGVLATYETSVHGHAVAAGDSIAPVCTDCHREHDIRPPAAEESSVFPTHIAEMCARCHDDEDVARTYGISADRLVSYRGSYHGVASRFGEERVANCASCHGWHDILPSSDPHSRVAPEKLAETCGECHRGATANFARGKVHLLGKADNPAAFAVQAAYVALMVVVLGGFVLFIVADLWGRFWRRRGPGGGHAGQSSSAEEDRLVSPTESFVRMNRRERLQHAVLVICFVSLVVTGLPLVFYDWPVLRTIGFMGGQFWLRSWLHRIFGVGLILVSVYHLVYVLTTRRGRQMFLALMPKAKDVTDAFGTLLHNVGIMEGLYRRGVLKAFLDRHPALRFKERPLYERYNFIEKFEYLAVFWGNSVMIITGLALWFFTVSLNVLPKFVLDVFLVVHSFEALLAFLAIIVWHMYNVHLNPSVFPMSRIWLTGRIGRDELKHEHPLEYQRLLDARREAARRVERPGPPRK